MSDFEGQWQSRFMESLSRHLGEHHLFQESSDFSHEPVSFTVRTMLQLEEIASREQIEEIMTSCSCRYPPEDLEDVRECYRTTGDPARAHAMLQVQFEEFLDVTLKLPLDIRREIVSRNWGLAGMLDGKSITATKIPKSGNILEYFAAKDSAERRALYCHCPRIRDAIAGGVPISPLYCYCGAGFYKGLWEDITGGPVTVKLLKSITSGDDVCSFEIYIQS